MFSRINVAADGAGDPPRRRFTTEAYYRESRALIFEEAISATGFGTFNIRLLLLTGLALAATIFENSANSYIITTAECDLHLSITDKGLLNTVAYLGMICGTLPWAIISDTRGRKIVLIVTHLMNGFCSLCCAFSQNLELLCIFKFMGGFTISGGFSTLMTYLYELHSAQHRTLVLQITGIMLTCSSMLLTTLAILILGEHWTVTIMGFHFHSWQVFFAVCGGPSFLFGFLFHFFPESPKYMLSNGNDELALSTLRHIFVENTGRSAEEYPITSLDSHMVMGDFTRARSSIQALVSRWRRFSLMLERKYIYLEVGVFLINFFELTCQNTLRLWLPQFFAAFEEYEHNHLGEGTVCQVLQYTANKNVTDIPSSKCVVYVSERSFFNNYVTGVFSIAFYFVPFILRKFVSPKLVLSASIFLSTATIIITYFATLKVVTVMSVSLYLALQYLTSSYIIYATLIYFPTQMRNTVLAVTMFWGRIGSSIGNAIFPLFIQMGCIPPFIFFFLLGILAFINSLFLPDPAKVLFV